MASDYLACPLIACLTSLLSFLTDEFKCPIKEEVALTSGEWEVLSRHGSKVPGLPSPSSRPGHAFAGLCIFLLLQLLPFPSSYQGPQQGGVHGEAWLILSAAQDSAVHCVTKC